METQAQSNPGDAATTSVSEMIHLTGLVEVACMFGLLIGLCAVLGLAVGSFLNVVIYRVPRNESIVTPRSVLPVLWRTHSGEGQHPGGLVADAPWSLP